MVIAVRPAVSFRRVGRARFTTRRSGEVVRRARREAAAPDSRRQLGHGQAGPAEPALGGDVPRQAAARHVEAPRRERQPGGARLPRRHQPHDRLSLPLTPRRRASFVAWVVLSRWSRCSSCSPSSVAAATSLFTRRSSTGARSTATASSSRSSRSRARQRRVPRAVDHHRRPGTGARGRPLGSRPVLAKRRRSRVCRLSLTTVSTIRVPSAWFDAHPPTPALARARGRSSWPGGRCRVLQSSHTTVELMAGRCTSTTTATTASFSCAT